jgi:hypothetical protein
MSDPRADLRFDGVHAEYTTYKIDGTEITYSATAAGGSQQVGLAVALAGDGIVDLCGDGEPVHGKLIAVEADGFCTVQTGGFCELPGGTSATLTRNTKIVGDLLVSAKGYIQTFAASSTVTAAEVTTAAVTKGVIVNSSVATAVVVDLG